MNAEFFGQLATQGKPQDTERYINAIRPILERVRRDVSAIKKPDGNCEWRKSEPLTDELIRQHLSGGVARGVAPIKPGQKTTRLALLDFDSHKGETDWAGMVEVASAVIDELEAHGYPSIPFRSGGGNGIHLYMLWDEPQDARSVRQMLTGVLAGLGFSNGTDGVAKKQIEIFPKQDAVAVGGYGNQFILPLAGKSEPLDHLFGLMPMGRDFILKIDWPTCPPVPVVAALPPSERSITSGEPEEIETLRSALESIPNDDDSRSYDDWFPIVCGIHEATGGSEAGRELAIEWSQRSPKFELKFFNDRVWRHIKPAQHREKAFTRASVYHEASKNGWQKPTSAEGMPDDVDTEAERNRDQARLNAARREQQRVETIRIGEGAAKVPAIGKISLDDALSNFVFLSDGSQVVDMRSPGNAYAFSDVSATYAASKVQQGDSEKKIPVATLWKTDPRRKTAEALTFKAGGPLLLLDPNGRMAVNSWRPIQREGGQDLMAAGVGLFLDHVGFLFPVDADRERFLDWAAHIEQKPGELPHTGWLHVARNFGMGRNWLASVFARVWPGYVAANLDLPGVLKSGFNGRLSRKLLAVVDEIREGGRDGPWEHAEKLKSIITEETRLVNPKYGRQSVEFNSCRFLLFSNHTSAIPIEMGDRRIEVVSIDAAPRSSDYYAKLYSALHDPGFINAVGVWLAQRDLRRFNPGAHASMSEAKLKVVQASMTPMAERCQTLIRLWPADVIKAQALYSVLQGPSGGDGSLTAFHRRTLEQFQVEPLGKKFRVFPGAEPVRVSVLRNHDKWRNADAGAIRAELAKCPDDFENAWHWLEGAEADQAT